MAPAFKDAAPKLALVSGASSGIGEAIAEHLAASGAHVFLAARRLDRLQALAKRINAAGGTARAVELDVSRVDSIAACLARIADEASAPLDWLVNAAGSIEVHPGFGLPAEESDALYTRHFDTLFHGARRLTEAVLPSMVARGSGAVVQIASAAAFRAFPGIAAYAAAKHALLGWSQSLALELDGSGVGVSNISPYYTETKMLSDAIEGSSRERGISEREARDEFRARNPGGAFVTPAQVAQCAAMLLSQRANGRCVVLDGGEPRELPELH